MDPSSAAWKKAITAFKDRPPSPEELAAAKEFVRQARAQRVALTGPGGF